MSDSMHNISVYDELDQAIDQMLASPEAADTAHECDGEMAEMVKLAYTLRDLPRANFKTRLKLELEWEAAGRTVSSAAETNAGRPRNAATAAPASQILPSVFGKTWAGYPVRKINFAFSAVLHGVMLLLIGAGVWAVKNFTPHIEPNTSVSSRLEPYLFPIGYHPNGGGGSGGAADKIPVSHGIAPKAAREQLTPPIMLHNNESPKLIAEATVIAPPEMNPPSTKKIGDPLSKIADFSNGPGVSNGIGGKFGGGAGEGEGPGRGVGRSGGCCDGEYTVGNGVSMPRPIYSPEPEFSEEARKVKHQGDVVLLATIGVDGHPHDLTIVRSLGMGLDEKALEAVSTWRFQPAQKNGHPVAVKMNIIVNFRLF